MATLYMCTTRILRYLVLVSVFVLIVRFHNAATSSNGEAKSFSSVKI